MSNYLKTLFRQTKSFELMEDINEEEAAQAAEDALAEQRWEREKHVTSLLKTAVDRMGLSLSDGSWPINYTEDERLATIKVLDTITLKHLEALSGFGSDIKVSAHGDELYIEIVIDTDIDTATIS